MKVLRGYRKAREKLIDPVIAIGIFDGVHLGHRKVIRRMMGSPGSGDRVILTFDPHPDTVLTPGKPLPRIMSLSHRLNIFQKIGIDAVIVVSFSKYIAGMSPENFMERVVVRGAGCRRVYVGDNFVLGKGGKGDTGRLSEIGKKAGVDICIVPSLKMGGKIISSTRVRKLVAGGDISEAEKLLGRPVSVLGTVVPGESIGRRMGVPTANLDPHHEVIPPVGVYAVKVDIDGGMFSGALNIGHKPTFYGRDHKRKEPSIEVHIMDFDGDLYGRDIEVLFINKIRDEKCFSGSRQLASQIEKDISAVRCLEKTM